MLAPEIYIDQYSGCCFGVVSAIRAAERYLTQHPGTILYCLEDIVHNSKEKERLHALGLRYINFQQYQQLRDAVVLIRAHGEPPQTYQIAYENNLRLLDASCPVVLRLQAQIRKAYEKVQVQGGSIIIFGVQGHAEVTGLLGQTFNTAIVVSQPSEIELHEIRLPIYLFSQTTKDQDKYEELVSFLKQKIVQHGGDVQQLHVHYTICRLVSSRVERLKAFARQHQVIVFVGDPLSSNGKYLYQVCKTVNPCSYFVTGAEDIEKIQIPYFIKTIGVSGATSTPRWLLEEVASKLKKLYSI